MPTIASKRPSGTLADVLHRLGDIPVTRIGLPVGSATEQDVIKHLDARDKRVFELIDGMLVEKVMGIKESILASIVVHQLWTYLDLHDLGVAFCADGPFRVRRGRIRFPDTGFISWRRLPNQEMPAGAILDAVPDLAIEVISKGNTAKEMELKLVDYFRSGVALVWYIYPETQSALAFTSPTRKKEIGLDGALDGARVLPGFRLPLKKLFAHGAARSRRNGSAPKK